MMIHLKTLNYLLLERVFGNILKGINNSYYLFYIHEKIIFLQYYNKYCKIYDQYKILFLHN